MTEIFVSVKLLDYILEKLIMDTNLREELPPLIQTLISNLNDRNQNVWQRQNYRMRLEAMKVKIDSAIKSYDDEATKVAKKRIVRKA